MQTIELAVTGMTCGACQNHVTQALQKVPGVQDVNVNLTAGRATVRGENLDTAPLLEAVEEEGYGAQVAPEESQVAAPSEEKPATSSSCGCCGS